MNTKHPSGEQRRERRRPFTASVVMSYPGIGLISGRARNISLAGMYVETGRVVLPLNSELQAHLTLAGRGQRKRYKLAAKVVRVEVKGVGLAFTEPRSSLRKLLANI